MRHLKYLKVIASIKATSRNTLLKYAWHILAGNHGKGMNNNLSSWGGTNFNKRNT